MAAGIWPTAYRGIISESQILYMLSSMYDPAKLQREMQVERIRYFWIDNGGSRVGFMAAGPVSAGAACALHKCYLQEDRQGKGIGSAAMTLLITILEQAGVPALELRVNRNNSRAIGFYRKNHFEIFAGDCLEIGGGFVMDDFLMRRIIPNAVPPRSIDPGTQ